MVDVKYPDPTWTNKIGHIDEKNYVDIKISKIISVGDMHFIYLESVDIHVNMNLGTIVYTGNLPSGITEGVFAKYMDAGNKLDFGMWTLQRDENNKWLFHENDIKQVLKNIQPKTQYVVPVVKTVKTVKKEKPKHNYENENLYEVFKIYLEYFSILCHKAENKTPIYKKSGLASDAVIKCNDLRRLLLAVQMVLETDLSGGQSKSVVIRNALISNGIMRLRDCAGFVKKMILAWNRDVKERIIDRKGVFLRGAEQSSILAVEWLGFTPNTEKGIFDRVGYIVKKRRGFLDSVEAAKSIGKKHVKASRNNSL